MRHAGWLSMTVVVVVVALALVVAAVPFVLPSEDVPAHKLAAAVIFVASYLALAVGKIPGLSIDRAGVALVGACLMVASGVLSLADAYKAIDSDTITLLLGMMIIVANFAALRLLRVITNWVMQHMHRPLTLLAAGKGWPMNSLAVRATMHHRLRVRLLDLGNVPKLVEFGGAALPP
jgi:di/tricarboxylate transporter